LVFIEKILEEGTYLPLQSILLLQFENELSKVGFFFNACTCFCSNSNVMHVSCGAKCSLLWNSRSSTGKNVV